MVEKYVDFIFLAVKLKFALKEAKIWYDPATALHDNFYVALSKSMNLSQNAA